MGGERDSSTETAGLTSTEREWLDAARATETLAALRNCVDAETDHEAYLEAKRKWAVLREKELAENSIVEREREGNANSTAESEREETVQIPGSCVVVDGRPVTVHGITHADTDEECEFLRSGVRSLLDDGASVYCEQGIRPMYFQDMDAVCEVDDYRWAMHHCRERDIDSHISGQIEREFAEDDSISADITTVASQFRDETFSLIKSGSSVYGDRFASALGDVASNFLTSHEELATGEDFASFRKSRRAARNPAELETLQRYYETVFLPQPLEREWLRRHDPEIELFTHARNERIAAAVLYHAPKETPVHIITGAAHQPGVVYYLKAYRDGGWTFEPFEDIP